MIAVLVRPSRRHHIGDIYRQAGTWRDADGVFEIDLGDEAGVLILSKSLSPAYVKHRLRGYLGVKAERLR